MSCGTRTSLTPGSARTLHNIAIVYTAQGNYAQALEYARKSLALRETLGDKPGVAKTLAVETLARVVGGTFARIQFTPDLVPADIVGTRIYRASSEKFDVELGPVFVNFLLADRFVFPARPA